MMCWSATGLTSGLYIDQSDLYISHFQSDWSLYHNKENIYTTISFVDLLLTMNL